MFGSHYGKQGYGMTPPIVPPGMTMGQPNAMQRRETQGNPQPKKKGGMFSQGGKGWDALNLIGGMVRDASLNPGQQGGHFDAARQGIMQGRQQKELEAKQAEQDRARQQAMQGMTPEQVNAFLLAPDKAGEVYAKSQFQTPETQTPQYFKSGDDIIGIGPDGQSRVAYDAPDGPMDANLPQGMELDPETGRPRFMPEYIDGQRAIAEARGGNGQNVQSVQVLQNGEIALIRRDGTFQQTGQFAKNPYQISDVGGVPTAIDRLSGTASQIATPEQVGGNKATIETVVGNEADRRTAQKDLPLAVEETQRAMAAIDGLLGHDGFDSRYGMTSIIPAIPGTAGAGAQAYIDQIGGQAFLQAFQSLKGGGQITEIEGQKATQAITRLTTQGIPPGEARRAAQELKTIMQRGLGRSRAQAGGSYAPQSRGAKPLVFNPETGEFE